VFSPTNENLIIGRATWAILPSTDNGKTWGYLCEDALALPGSSNFEDPELGLTANNALVAGLSIPTVGLDVSPDLGCNWNCIGGPLDNQSIADIVVRPDTPHQVLALTGTSGTTVDAGNASQVYESVDDGTTWNPLGNPIDPAVTVLTIDVSATDPNQIYVSGTRGYGTGLTASLFISSDKGMNWVEHAIPGFNSQTPCQDTPTVMCPTESGIFIGAVDPTDPTRVYLRSEGIAGSLTPSNSRLYVTTDGGQTFTVPKSFVLPAASATNPNSDFIVTGEMLGFALSPDGSTVYIGTREAGLWTASKTDLAFTQTNAVGGDRASWGDLGNAQVFMQKTDGLIQFFVQAGAYSLPALGSPYIKASSITGDTYGVAPQAFVKFVPNSNFSIMIGKLPTLIGSEYTFTFENTDIERGLLWNQENAVNRGVQVNYAKGPLTVSLSWNDGFYSNRYNWASALVAYAITPQDTITAVAVAWSREYAQSTVNLFFFVPVRGKVLFWITIGFCVLDLIYPSGIPEGVVAPFGGVIAGLLWGGTPSLARTGWLHLKLAVLRRRSSSIRVEDVLSSKPKRRPRGPGSPPLRVVPGGLDEVLKKRTPPKDKRYLN